MEKRIVKEKIITFIKANFIVWSFIALTVLIELTAICVTCGKFYIRHPWMFLSMLSISTAVLCSIKKQRGRYWCSFVLLLVQFIVDLVFIVVFDMTGSTFDYSMFKLGGDAMAILEGIPVNFIYVLVSGILISLYMVLAYYYVPVAPVPHCLMPRPAIAGVLVAILAFHACMAYFDNYKTNANDLTPILDSGAEGSYSDRGIVANFVDELYRGAFFYKVELGNPDELETDIFASDTREKHSPMFGAAQDYNVVTILGESLEWFSFMHDLATDGSTYAETDPANPSSSEYFPGGFAKAFPQLTGKQIEYLLREIYPNLYEFYDTSVVCLNHHSREKTDISENHSIIGNYPLNRYINYDFPQNTIPYSIPNILQTLYGIESYSFHDGVKDFYNRAQFHTEVLGFKQFVASEQMAEEHPLVFTDYNWSVGEHNHDSDMIEACKEEMFPTDRRFNTYITTISMHGQYDYRENFLDHYDILTDYDMTDAYLDVNGELKKCKDPFVYYAATAIELDRAIGVMMDYLKNTKDESGTPLIDKTIITLFGDHNAYYQNLTNSVKNISLLTDNGRNVTDLYRVPLMMHIGNQTEQQIITKFTCTTDIYPTILDLLGIDYFDNLTYGQSIFSDEESILYSRAYNAFMTDKVYFTSINNMRYRSEDADTAYIEEHVRPKATELLYKTSLVNRIFNYDFLSGNREQLYYKKLKELNGIN